MTNQFFKSLTVGFARRWRAALTQALGVVGAIWLVTEIVTRVSKVANDWLTANGDNYLTAVMCTGALLLVTYAYERRKTTFQVPTTSSYVTIKFGNIFEENADWLIGVNEFFDGQLGQVIAKTSVHGQFITNAFNGNEKQFRVAVEAALAHLPRTQTTRPSQPSMSYEIGTTAVLANGPHKAFLVAMSQTNHITHKAGSTVPMMWDAMKGALQAVHNHGNGQPLAMPLIGNGLSSVNIEPQHLLRLIVLAIVDFGRKIGLPKQVTIVLPEACFEQLDIREIRRDWMKR
jgi:hypothetical protein